MQNCEKIALNKRHLALEKPKSQLVNARAWLHKDKTIVVLFERWKQGYLPSYKQEQLGCCAT